MADPLTALRKALSNRRGVLTVRGSRTCHSREGGEGSSEIIPLAAGGAPTRVAFEGYAGTPAWSPVGKALAFAGHDPAGFDIYVQRDRGQTPVKLAGDRAWEVNPRWSPDGTHLAFLSQKNGNRDIAVVPATGGSVRFVTTTPADEGEFQWTPDGKSFVLTSRNRKASSFRST